MSLKKKKNLKTIVILKENLKEFETQTFLKDLKESLTIYQYGNVKMLQEEGNSKTSLEMCNKKIQA